MTHGREDELRACPSCGACHAAFQRMMERESIYENALATLPLRGQGNPVDYKYGYEGLTVTVENPYNEHLLAGQMAALFEIAEGKAAVVEWYSPEPASIIFSVSQADAG